MEIWIGVSPRRFRLQARLPGAFCEHNPVVLARAQYIRSSLEPACTSIPDVCAMGAHQLAPQITSPEIVVTCPGCLIRDRCIPRLDEGLLAGAAVRTWTHALRTDTFR